jgi:hypothetical protein
VLCLSTSRLFTAGDEEKRRRGDKGREVAEEGVEGVGVGVYR